MAGEQFAAEHRRRADRQPLRQPQAGRGRHGPVADVRAGGGPGQERNPGGIAEARERIPRRLPHQPVVTPGGLQDVGQAGLGAELADGCEHRHELVAAGGRQRLHERCRGRVAADGQQGRRGRRGEFVVQQHGGQWGDRFRTAATLQAADQIGPEFGLGAGGQGGQQRLR